MQIKKMTIFTILLLGLLTGCNKKDETISEEAMVKPKETTHKVQEQKLPTFHLTTTQGKEITIKVTKNGWIFPQYKNKVILLTFFATWCPPCKAEIPHLINLQNKYKDQLQVIAIVVEQNKDNEVLKEFIKEHKIIYPVTNSNENFNVASAVGGVSSIPAMFLFTQDGLVANDYVGAVHEEILESDIKKLLGQ